MVKPSRPIFNLRIKNKYLRVMEKPFKTMPNKCKKRQNQKKINPRKTVQLSKKAFFNKIKLKTTYTNLYKKSKTLRTKIQAKTQSKRSLNKNSKALLK